MAMAAAYGSLSPADHSAQLRKAVIASTIGTTIEWYDFFLYGTAAGLIFGKLFFPNEDPLTRRSRPSAPISSASSGADRGRHLRALRRSHRPQGNADRHAPVHGHRDLPDRLRADLRVDRDLGAVILTILRMFQGIGVGARTGGQDATCPRCPWRARPFHREQHRAAPFAADADALEHAAGW